MSLSIVFSILDDTDYLRKLPHIINGRGLKENVAIIKVASFLLGSGRLSAELIRRGLFTFNVVEKMSASHTFYATLGKIQNALRFM
jgi:hypothetical protein